MHHQTIFCGSLLCCLALFCCHTDAKPSPLKRAITVGPAHAAVSLPLPGGGTATLQDAYVQGANRNKTSPPPPTTAPFTCYHGACKPKPLVLPANTTAGGYTSQRHTAQISIPATTSDTSIKYNGGKVMSDGANVYMIYVGYKPTDATPLWMNYLVASLANTRWWAVMSGYAVGHKNFSTDIRSAGATYISHVRNNTDIDEATRIIVRQAMEKKLVAKDTNKGIYIVVSGPNVGLPTCELNGCGYHGHLDDGTKYVHIGAGCSECGLAKYTNNGTTSPTGDATLDGACDTLVHELAETGTDPTEFGWYDIDFNENDDKCAWDYGLPDRYSFPSGHKITYNQIVAGYPFLLQRIWDPKLDCAGEQTGCVYGGIDHQVAC